MMLLVFNVVFPKIPYTHCLPVSVCLALHILRTSIAKCFMVPLHKLVTELVYILM